MVIFSVFRVKKTKIKCRMVVLPIFIFCFFGLCYQSHQVIKYIFKFYTKKRLELKTVKIKNGNFQLLDFIPRAAKSMEHTLLKKPGYFVMGQNIFKNFGYKKLALSKSFLLLNTKVCFDALNNFYSVLNKVIKLLQKCFEAGLS